MYPLYSDRATDKNNDYDFHKEKRRATKEPSITITGNLRYTMKVAGMNRGATLDFNHLLLGCRKIESSIHNHSFQAFVFFFEFVLSCVCDNIGLSSAL